jgi:hypothetical protein
MLDVDRPLTVTTTVDAWRGAHELQSAREPAKEMREAGRVWLIFLAVPSASGTRARRRHRPPARRPSKKTAPSSTSMAPQEPGTVPCPSAPSRMLNRV